MADCRPSHLKAAQGQWIPAPDGEPASDLHRFMVGKMTGLHRRLRGITLADWAGITGISMSAITAAETNRACSHATACALLDAARLQRTAFTRAALEPGLMDGQAIARAARLGRAAVLNLFAADRTPQPGRAA